MRNLRLGTKAYERTIFDLRRLTPPPSDAASFHELLHALDRSDLTLHQLLYAVEAGRARSAKALARKADAASKRLNSMAARLGLHVCAKP